MPDLAGTHRSPTRSDSPASAAAPAADGVRVSGGFRNSRTPGTTAAGVSGSVSRRCTAPPARSPSYRCRRERDRWRPVRHVIDRVLGLAMRAAAVRRQPTDAPARHQARIREHGTGPPEGADWGRNARDRPGSGPTGPRSAPGQPMGARPLPLDAPSVNRPGRDARCRTTLSAGPPSTPCSRTAPPCASGRCGGRTTSNYAVSTRRCPRRTCGSASSRSAGAPPRWPPTGPAPRRAPATVPSSPRPRAGSSGSPSTTPPAPVRRPRSPSRSPTPCTTGASGPCSPSTWSPPPGPRASRPSRRTRSARTTRSYGSSPTSACAPPAASRAPRCAAPSNSTRARVTSRPWRSGAGPPTWRVSSPCCGRTRWPSSVPDASRARWAGPSCTICAPAASPGVCSP